MQLDPRSGWLDQATICHSPHFDARPSDTEISLLVIHNISLPPGRFATGDVQRFFAGKLDPSADPYFAGIAGMRVSSHFFIERDGAPSQFVSCNDRAWHAGRSRYAGREACNDFSIGIELEGTDELPYSDQQYRTLVELTMALQKVYPALHTWRITGHEHIAPGRKTDPGPAFDWQRYFAALAAECGRFD
ncbi:MAG: 1,6-anhydro-N-acetylmuramyl-L-alanine amidase AmpD [Halopseudomonas yangmingensis]